MPYSKMLERLKVNHSGLDQAGKGVVGKGSQNFIYQKIPNKEVREILRNTDSEYKILDNLADKLGNNTSVKGNVTLFTERTVKRNRSVSEEVSGGKSQSVG